MQNVLTYLGPGQDLGRMDLCRFSAVVRKWQQLLRSKVRKHLYTASVTEHWHREVVESPSLKTFKSRLDRVLRNGL